MARDGRHGPQDPPAAGGFSEGELEGLPEPVRRYFRAAIAPDAPLATAARLRMRGAIRVGGRWLPFRARELLAPHRGLEWTARAAGVIAGADRYRDGEGAMDWRLLGLVPVARAAGPDVARSAAGRVAGEAVWVPTALLPRFGVEWTAQDERRITARHRLDGHEHELRIEIDGDGAVRRVALLRWGDPWATGGWALHPFGFEAAAHARFGPVTIPSAGRAGWFSGTGRQLAGEFFRCEITAHRLVDEEEAAGA